jgi:hypothetical protein
MRWNEQTIGSTAIHQQAWIWRWALALLATGIVGTLAFGQLFTTFVPWDDEGYFLRIYRHFLSGRILYDQIRAIYGPLTFFCGAAVARFNPANVTHDTFRWASLPAWVLIAALLAGVVWRWTGRFTPSLVAFLMVGYRLKGLARAVGHPQLWIILASAVVLWLGLDWAFQTDGRVRAFWMGIVLGAVLLIKINIGFYLFIGVALALGLHLKGRFGVLLCGPVALAAAGLGTAILFVAQTPGERYFALAYLLSIAATVTLAAGQTFVPQLKPSALIWLAGGLSLCLCLGVFLTLAAGTTLQSLFTELIIWPRQFAARYHLPFGEPAGTRSLLLCLLGVIAAVGFICLRKPIGARPEWIGILKFVAGSGLLCGFCYDKRIVLTGSLLFLWLLITDCPPRSGAAYSNRLLLAVLSPVFSLQLFPIAGEQVAWAALMPMTAAAVLVADGLNRLEHEGIAFLLARRTAFIARSLIALLLVTLFAYTGAKAAQSWEQWNRNRALNLDGTHWLRLPPSEQDRLQATVAAISRNCHEVLTIPRMASFSLWSGVPLVEAHSPDDISESELRDLRQRNQGCVLFSRDNYLFWRELAISQGTDALLPEIQRTMDAIFAGPDLTLYRSFPIREPAPDPIAARGVR